MATLADNGAFVSSLTHPPSDISPPLPICWRAQIVSVCFNEIVLPCSLTVGCLSQHLNSPAVTTAISISLTHTRSARSALFCARFVPRIRLYGERPCED